TYMTLADELAEVLDDGDNLRVIPIVTYGAASNLDDLLYLRGVDVAMVQSDVFEYFRTQRKTLNLERRIHYISRLPVSEMHVLAGADIKTALCRHVHARRVHHRGISDADSAGGEDRHYRGAGGARSFQLAEKYRSLLACAKVYRGSFHQVGQVFGNPPPSKMA